LIIRLHIEVLRGNILTYNYQYPLAGWVYKTIASADRGFAEFLHQEGYALNGKKFRHFTFSPLDFGLGGRGHIPNSDRFYVNTTELQLDVRFFVPEAAEKFVSGLFREQAFGLGDKINQLGCRVRGVDLVRPPAFTTYMEFVTLSPILLSVPRHGSPARYLHPITDDEAYGQVFCDNLRQKWLSLSKPMPEGEVVFTLLPETEVKKQGITIKAHTEAQTQVIPYHYRFGLRAPGPLMQLGYYSGFGLEGSMGLGCCEVVFKIER
jgi:CRISPR-associated endoribonuclease Cas6